MATKINKVAILAPRSVRGEFGGAERFYDELVSAFIHRGYQTELVNIPCDESTFENVIQNYEACKGINLDEYDLVVSTKAPTYAVRHHNHILYLLHTTRVFYDMFDIVFKDKSNDHYIQRQEVIDLDNMALDGVKNIFTIGHEVSNRLLKWNGRKSEVLHPPLPSLDFYNSSQGDYIYMPGRLHDWKRVHLAIEAVKLSTLPLSLIISGDGDAAEKLKNQAGSDPRIKFVGRISDQEVLKYYANALCVAFLPIHEDYGYVALEAMASSKPVVTCSDSGEPTYFIKNMGNGLVCEPNAESLRDAFEFLFANRNQASQLGDNALKSNKMLEWPDIVDRIVESSTDEKFKLNLSKRTKINVAVIDMQPIEPAVGGGRIRLKGLYHNLGTKFNCRYVGTYDWRGESFRRINHSESLEEITVPLSAEHFAANDVLIKKCNDKNVIDLMFSKCVHLSQDYVKHVLDAIKWSDVVIFSHPWVYPFFEEFIPEEKILIYDSHNVEGVLRAHFFDKTRGAELDVMREVVSAENSLLESSDYILACSEEDKQLFAKFYGTNKEKIGVFPNGVFVDDYKFSEHFDKRSLKAKYGFRSDRKSAIFIGSNYLPNVESADFICKDLAPYLSEYDFIIAGGVGEALKGVFPDNVFVTGYLTENQKNDYLAMVDIAINPMFSGSGTNIKMFDFMANGLPIVTTSIGARGIEHFNSPGIVISAPKEFKHVVKRILEDDKNQISHTNLSLVRNEFSWECISPRLGEIITEILPGACKGAIAHISTIGHKCGIGEYTLNLIKTISRLSSINNLSVTCTTTSAGMPSLSYQGINSICGWHWDDVNYSKSEISSELLNKLSASKIKTVIMQYHKAYLGSDALLKFVRAARKRKIEILLVIHSLDGWDVDLFQNLSAIGIKFVSHSSREVEIAKRCGINFELLAVPIAPKPEAIENNQDHYPVIGTTGFLREHKGLEELIRAIDIVRKSYPRVKLIAQCALYPSSDSESVLAKCKAIIRELNLDDVIELNHDFIDQAEIPLRLSNSNLCVLPYANSEEGGSASAANCIATRVPLIVSSARVFDELRATTFKLETNSPECIANSIIYLLKTPDAYNTIKENTSVYADSNSFENVALKYLEILDSASKRRHNLI
jgi:glycosyltransferase involved in cell wall biosynthesis